MDQVQAILGVDPGHTVGVARYFVGRGFDGAWEMGLEEYFGWLDIFCRANEGAFHVAHELNVFMRAQEVKWAFECQGVARHLCLKHGGKLILRPVGDAKVFCSNARLKELGWKQQSSHANDACRHLLLHLASLGWYDGSVIKEPA